MAPDPTDHDLLISLIGDVKHIQEKVIIITDRLDDKYVTRAEFAPIQKIVYLLVGLMLSGVGGAVVSLVLKGTP